MRLKASSVSFILVAAVFISALISFHQGSYCTSLMDELQVCPEQGIYVSLRTRSSFLKARLGHAAKRYESCSSSENEVCLRDEQDRVTIKPISTPASNVRCYQVKWDRPSNNTADCFNLGVNIAWYGGSEVLKQHWPIKNVDISKRPYITNDFYHSDLGNVLDNLWISSDGVAIFVERTIPLSISLNSSADNQLCLSTSYDTFSFLNVKSKPRGLKYFICSATDVRAIYEYALKTWIEKPRGIPDAGIFKHPIWSTWANFKKTITQDVVLKFAKDIVGNNLPRSVLGIDDVWDVCYGEQYFNPQQFPNPTEMVRQLHTLGFKVLLWVHPFINKLCASYKTANSNQYLLMDSNGNPAQIHWWNGIAGTIDVTNPSAVSWFINKLDTLRTTHGVDAFKFDAGELYWLPKNITPHDTSEVAQNPNFLTKKYVEMATKLGGLGEVRCGFDSQKYPTWIRMMDKDTRWGYNNGLKSLIPTALLFSLLGYPFILPDYVAGNAYDEDPSKDLFIRWLQATTFMPSIQLSVPPWNYDVETVNIARKLLKLHEQYSQLLISLAQNATETGLPIIRPLWWASPDDRVTYFIDDEFLVGDMILVAPVLEEKTRQRDIYLPRGLWKDEINLDFREGPLWLRGYEAGLDILPYFTKS